MGARDAPRKETTLTAPDEPVRSLDALIEPFHEAEKPPRRFRIGTEAEKFGVFVADGRPLPFDGPRSVRTVFERLVQAHGWFEEREHREGAVISLRRGPSSITLEPGAQLELSGAPLETVHQTCSEFRAHMAELADISSELGLAWIGLGFHPLARPDDLPWVPKLRYGVMKQYLPTRGSMALDMMQRTATVQANLDYSSEGDAMRKLRLALRISSIVTAMFANSPFVEGRATGERSHRARVWLHMDPDRSGLLPFAWRQGARYADYAEWALDAPMFMIKRDDRMLANTGQTFRAFMADGFEGERPTRSDWETHLNTLFPEVRLKKTLEVRGADSQRTSMICALPALWKGLLYAPAILDRLEEATASLTYEAVEASRAGVADLGLGADLDGRPVRAWAEELLELAREGLSSLSHLDKDGRDESVHLSSLGELVDAGHTPADELLWRVGADSREEASLERILAHTQV